jgi:hypothetical protein
VLRWIKPSIPADSSWFLVFARYVDEQAGRVRDLGGEPDAVGADPNGDWKHVIELGGKGGRGGKDGRDGQGGRDGSGGGDADKGAKGGERLTRFTGKVASLEFDRYGEYYAFVLDTEDGRRRFEGREVELQRLVDRAWRERTTISVDVERHDLDRPIRIVLHAATAATED